MAGILGVVLAPLAVFVFLDLEHGNTSLRAKQDLVEVLRATDWRTAETAGGKASAVFWAARVFRSEDQTEWLAIGVYWGSSRSEKITHILMLTSEDEWFRRETYSVGFSTYRSLTDYRAYLRSDGVDLEASIHQDVLEFWTDPSRGPEFALLLALESEPDSTERERLLAELRFLPIPTP